jgi:hypothetical protein
LPLMEQDAVGLTKRELIAEVITPNLPKPWQTNFKLLKLNRKTKIREVLDELVVMEETIKLEKKQGNQQGGNKISKIPAGCIMVLTSGQNANKILRMATTVTISRRQTDKIRSEAVKTMEITVTVRNKEILKTMKAATEILQQEAEERQIMMMKNHYVLWKEWKKR